MLLCPINTPLCDFGFLELKSQISLRHQLKSVSNLSAGVRLAFGGSSGAPGAGLAASAAAAVFNLACHARNARGESLTAFAMASTGALACDSSAIVQSWVIVGFQGFILAIGVGIPP
jgi:hypothetical protein